MPQNQSEPKGTLHNPIRTDSEGERCFKFCQCARCKKVKKCTPSHDFYIVEARNDDLLICDVCLYIANEEAVNT